MKAIFKISFRGNLFLFVYFLLSISIYGQIAFDVKTTMEEKRQLHVVKVAVINTIKQSNWATAKEVGENYSLWLTNYKQTKIGDSVNAEMDIDLRTPAMFTRGSHITSRHISVTFDTTGIPNNSSNGDTLLGSLLETYLLKSNIMSALTNLVPMVANMSVGSLFIVPFIKSAISELKRKPTPMETFESNILAAKTIVVLEETIRKLQR